MTSRAICVALLAVLPAAGCGTVANLAHTNPDEGGRVPFGGVKRDLAAMHQPPAPVGPRAPHNSDADYSRRTSAVWSAVDLPFSFVGDLVTWPYVRIYLIVNAPVPVPPVTFADPSGAQSQPPAPAPKPMPVPVPPGPPNTLAPLEREGTGAAPLAR